MKTYINPEVRVVLVDSTEVIATSLEVTTAEYYENDPTLAPGALIWDEEE